MITLWEHTHNLPFGRPNTTIVVDLFTCALCRRDFADPYADVGLDAVKLEQGLKPSVKVCEECYERHVKDPMWRPAGYQDAPDRS